MSKYSNEFKIKVVNAAGDVNKTRKSIFDENNIYRPSWKNEGIQPSGLPLITDLLDKASNDSWRYSKKASISMANKIFDYIQENGTIEQLEKAYKIYGDTDFNKKSEAVSSLKQLLELTKKD